MSRLSSSRGHESTRDPRLRLNEVLPGTVIWIDWRDRQMRGEPGSIRPSIVISDAQLVPSDFDIVTVIPMTGDEHIAIPALSLRIEPDESNGLLKASFALAFNVQSIASRRIVHATSCTIRESELARIRSYVAEWLGMRQIDE